MDLHLLTFCSFKFGHPWPPSEWHVLGGYLQADFATPLLWGGEEQERRREAARKEQEGEEREEEER